MSTFRLNHSPSEDAARRLECALQGAGSQDAQPAQVVAQPMPGAEYASWRATNMRAHPGVVIPKLEHGHYAVVMFVMRPSATLGFLRTGRTTTLLCPPVVGQFSVDLQPQEALALTLAAFLEDYPAPLQLAPPILGREVVDFGHLWPMPKSEAVGC